MRFVFNVFMALVVLHSASRTNSEKVKYHATDRLLVQYHNRNVTRKSNGLRGIEVVPLEDGDNVHDIVNKLSAHEEISHVELDYQVQALIEPNDAKYGMQWGFNTANVPSAWDESVGNSAVTVCVIDTGIDYTHSDLATNIHPLRGWNAINQTADPMDDNGHGTHCAGIIGAIGNNSNGVTGVNWKIQMLGCKFLDSSGVGYISGILACLDYCIQNNASISSNSYSIEGLDRQSSILKDAIAQAAQKEHLFIAAAGNAGQDNDLNIRPSFPAGFSTPNMISVAALEAADAPLEAELASYSNIGYNTVHIAAPGSQILSTWPGNWLAYLSGTSMAAPHVAGAAALIKAATNGMLSNMQIRSTILETAKKLPGLEAKVSTQGMLDVGAAMNRSMQLANSMVQRLIPSPLQRSPPSPSPLAYDILPRPSPISDKKDNNNIDNYSGDISSFVLSMEVSGTSCVAFSRKAQGICSSLLRLYAGMRVRDIRTTCKGPALFGKDRYLLISSIVTMSQGQSGKQAMKNIKNMLQSNTMENDVSQQLKDPSFKLRTFTFQPN